MDHEIGKAFLIQARLHLNEDFMPKIANASTCFQRKTFGGGRMRPTTASGTCCCISQGTCGSGLFRESVESQTTGSARWSFRNETRFQNRSCGPRCRMPVAEASQILESFPAERLLEKRKIQGFDNTALQAIFHVVEHFSLHTGQVIYITKLREGRDLKFYNLIAR